MTRKHFEALTESLRDVFPDQDSNIGAWNAWEDATRAIADTCAMFNPNFDRNRFLDACLPPTTP